jgi:hypothetical protein
MRAIEEVNRVLAFVKDEINDSEISRRTGIPRVTIRDWRRGKVPGTVRHAAAKESCPTCGHPRHDFTSLPDADYAYLLGLYLGDGCISAGHRGVYRLRIVLDRAYPQIVKECGRAMASVMPTSRVGVVHRKRQQADEVGSYSRAWPCLFPQHGPGQKHSRPIWLADWQRRITHGDPRPLIRGLIHSDGWRGTNLIRHPKRNYSYPRYQFCNHSADIRRIFCDHLDLLGIDWRVMNRWNISVARRVSVAALDEFVGPKQ